MQKLFKKYMKTNFKLLVIILNFSLFTIFTPLTFNFSLLTFNLNEANAAVLQKAPTNLGLVGYWSFNEGTTTTALDYSGNKNNGTLRGMTIANANSGWKDGKLGKALSFDGSNDSVLINTNPTTSTSSWAISAWINPRTLPVRRFIIQNGSDTSGYGFSIGNGAGATGSKLEGNNLGVASIDSGFTFPSVNRWYHVVMTRDPVTTRFYVNGIQTSGTYSGNFNTPTSTLKIGGQEVTNFFPGLIDEVRVYNKGLSSNEVIALYNSGTVKFINPNNLGLVGYWSFNEGTTTTALDYSGNKNKGTLINGPVWVNGKMGKALSFDGSNDYVTIPHNANQLLTNGFTFSAWIKPITTGEGQVGRVLQKTGDAVGTGGYVFRVSGSSPTAMQMRMQVNAGTARDSGTFNSSNIWTHILVTVAANATVTHYINGVTSGTPGATGALSDISTTTPLLIGNDSIQARTFNGLIDDVRVYNRVLSANEVAALYNSGAVKHTNPNNLGLVGYWSFNEGTTTTALDYSGNKNKGTLINGPVWVNGKMGKALSFDGTNDRVSLANPLVLDLTVNYTITAWIKPAGFGGGNLGRIYDAGNNTTQGWVFSLDNSTLVEGYKLITQNANAITSNSNRIILNQWQYIAVTVSNSTAGILYYNGLLDKSAILTQAALNNATAPINIGGRTVDTTRNFDGIIDEVRIYNRALGADEVLKIYNAGR